MLLGFDMRLRADDYVAARWDAAAREAFLLKPDIAWPRSVDVAVWPSVFRWDGVDPYPGAFAWGGPIDVRPRDFREQVLHLWSDLAAMRACCNAGLAAVPIAIVAATDETGLAAVLAGTTIAPAECPADWTLLGYDVADSGFTSGLANCGYTTLEKADFARAWAPRLDAHGLLTTLDDARAFRDATDARVPEHAPFAVYALHAPPGGDGQGRPKAPHSGMVVRQRV